MPRATAAKPATKTAAQKIAHARSAEPVLVKGRRDFFKYRDLGVADASAGNMRAQVMSSSRGMSRPTGWHYHECEGQFIYILKGWVDLEFEDGRTIRVDEGVSSAIATAMVSAWTSSPTNRVAFFMTGLLRMWLCATVFSD